MAFGHALAKDAELVGDECVGPVAAFGARFGQFDDIGFVRDSCEGIYSTDAVDAKGLPAAGNGALQSRLGCLDTHDSQILSHWHQVMHRRASNRFSSTALPKPQLASFLPS